MSDKDADALKERISMLESMVSNLMSTVEFLSSEHEVNAELMMRDRNRINDLEKMIGQMADVSLSPSQKRAYQLIEHLREHDALNAGLTLADCKKLLGDVHHEMANRAMKEACVMCPDVQVISSPLSGKKVLTFV
jgi:ABC-type microcin C transport system duplicated ATPase subunit YejF